jgi:hypothetical protein
MPLGQIPQIIIKIQDVSFGQNRAGEIEGNNIGMEGREGQKNSEEYSQNQNLNNLTFHFSS